MQDQLNRRRFLGSAICYSGTALLLQGCGGEGQASNGGGNPIVVVPAPTPSPAPSPTPSPAPSPAPSKPITIAFAGSSSAEQYLTLYSGSASNPLVTASSDGINFAPLTVGAFGKTAGDLINRAAGRPVRFLRGGIGGTTLAQWAAPSSPQRAATVAAIKAAGGVDAILLQVGRNDAANLIVPDTESQTALLRSLISALRTEADVPNATVFIGASQDLLGGTIEQHRQLGRQRLAEITVAASVPNVRYGFSTYDLETIDSIHQTEAAQLISGTRFAAQVIAWLQNAPQQRGPRIIGVTFVSQTQTDVELQLSVGNDISPPNEIDGFQMIAVTSLSELAIVGAQRRGPTTVRLAHEERGTRQVRVAYGLDHDINDNTCLRDNSINRLPAEPYLSTTM